ncbi:MULTISPECIES: polysaccharide deacetylase family protein [unclassified Streptomyces]|uniref:polysaccharide deacetylase family protein n=1 Tax=unclassified Streptomyces TaxID=2593676 RepID=UPI001660E64E|nr:MULTISPECIES: polysaccharide deacetylase family protein [unclassified Streptomyces]MBD0711673.1 polysaccharide deacetylase [Streptomyces sp. CBMA291]MBD0713916.1 polysaccharide deacetylase [Streptomyces sp. CBMA370]
MPATALRRMLPKPPLWVAMYHSIADTADDPYRVTVSPVRFARQLCWLGERGLRGVSVRELLAATAEGRAAGLVGLTFDDGYADFAESALPLLLRHGFTATVYVLPGRLGGENAWDAAGPRKPLLSGDGIRRIAEAGMEIGSHGLTHVPLTETDERTLTAETRQSRTLLEELTGTPVDGFCYPYGQVDPRAIGAVRAAGYRYACAIDPGPYTGAYALPRVHIGEDDTAWRLAAKRLLHPLRRRRPTDLTPVRPGPAVVGAS